ncbi:hypothetical protein [Streptomyces sp. NPDC088258]|uniref:hypothetical protein n=1 Tax=Streptomyces sp. NPDC088258 TaxID=3365849 RepID=UPI0037FF70E0
MATRDPARLAPVAKQRRIDLGIALDDKNAKAGGTSKGTWSRVEKGLRVRDLTYPKIDALLQWASGSCVAVMEGREPVPARASEAAPGATISEMSATERSEKAREIVQLSAIATTSGLTADEIRALSDRATRALKEAGLI